MATAAMRRANGPGREPAIFLSRPVEVEEERRDAGHDQRRAQVVDGVLAADGRQLQGHRCDDEGGDANRQVDIEDPAPAGSVGEPAAQQWSRHAGDAEHRAEISLVATALARGDDVADDTEREGHQPAAADPLDGSEGDQLRQVLTQAAQDRTGEEDQDCGLKDVPPAVEIRDLAPERRRGGGRQQVGGHHPGELVEPTQLADDASAARCRRCSGRARPARLRP